MWARPDSISQTDWALYCGALIIEYYEEFFQIPYPLPKQGRCVVVYVVSLSSVNCDMVVVVEFVVDIGEVDKTVGGWILMKLNLKIYEISGV